MTQLAKLTDEEMQALELVEAVASVLGDGCHEGFSNLSEMQRKFASAFVLLKGDATKAAQVAGYNNPSVMGTRATINPKVGELIRVLSLANAHATLPVAIATLAELAADPKVKAETRRNCALDLAKIAQAMGSSGPSVAVQVNASGGTSKDGEALAPTVVLQHVWRNRDERMSSIAPPMPDTSTRQLDDGAHGVVIEGGGG